MGGVFFYYTILQISMIQEHSPHHTPLTSIEGRHYFYYKSVASHPFSWEIPVEFAQMEIDFSHISGYLP